MPQLIPYLYRNFGRVRNKYLGQNAYSVCPIVLHVKFLSYFEGFNFLMMKKQRIELD